MVGSVPCRRLGAPPCSTDGIGQSRTPAWLLNVLRRYARPIVADELLFAEELTCLIPTVDQIEWYVEGVRVEPGKNSTIAYVYRTPRHTQQPLLSNSVYEG